MQQMLEYISLFYIFWGVVFQGRHFKNYFKKIDFKVYFYIQIVFCYWVTILNKIKFLSL